jgi:CubicO group peptidase (beta-lactamase class C family)
MMRLLVALLFFGAAISAAALDINAAAAYSKKHRGASLLIIQNGRTLHAENANEPLRIYSGTKAFWGLAALAAAQDGILNLDERVAETIPSWRNDPRKSRVTVRQLLDFSAGLDPAFHLHRDDPGNRDAIAISRPILAEPGSAFIYGPAALQVFHAVLKTKLRGETPRAYLRRRVLRPLGLGDQRHLPDRTGNPLLAAGWIMSARDWAKIGQLPLRGRGQMSQAWRGSPANAAYSLGWWNNRAAPGGREVNIEDNLTPRWHSQNWSNVCISRVAPPDLVACVGSSGQRLYVIPSMQLVVVRHGRGGNFSDAQFLRLLLAR